MAKRTILLTNDDGIYGPGLKPLKSALSKLGHVVCIVPEQERSAASHALTLHKPLRVQQVSRNIYILNGTPADCTRFGILHLLMSKVDLVVSGINSGVNLGEDVIYSGTVAAAVEGAMLGLPAVAVSRPPEANPSAYVPAAAAAARVAKNVLKRNLPPGVCLNVNVPAARNGRAPKLKGFVVTQLGHRVYGKKVTIRRDPRGRHYYWLIGKNVLGVPTPGSDVEAFEKGYVTITPVTTDWTALAFLTDLKRWKF
ncbi:MAG: 5'/3'-nucleotidase SurE [Elusimicrobia bacterium]|nr:5'/3'-nucleotidase SurE [Elusimicrobiota bacterium]